MISLAPQHQISALPSSFSSARELIRDAGTRMKSAGSVLTTTGRRSRRLRAAFATPEKWGSLSDADLLQLLQDQCFIYADTANDARYALLRHLYALVMTRVDTRARRQLLWNVARGIASRHARGHVTRRYGATRALTPFMFVETDLEIVLIASFEFATLLPTGDKAVLAGPIEVIAIALRYVTVESTRAGALLASVLWLGDRRAVALLGKARQKLDDQAYGAMLQARSESVMAAHVDFVVDCLEEALVARNEDRWVRAANALAWLGEQATKEGVREIERIYPGSDYDGDDAIRVVAYWTREEYAERIAHRLTGMVQAWPGTTLGPVFEAWGLSDPAAASPVAPSSTQPVMSILH